MVCFLKLVAAVLLFTLPTSAVHAGGVVSNPTEADLRTALVGGGSVTFDCDGTIFLGNSLVITNATVMSAAGRNITLSGGNSVRVLVVNPGVDLTLNFIKVQNGKAAFGAGLLNNGGSVTANNCDFSFNSAAGTNGLPTAYTNQPPHGESASGGAVFNTGSFAAANSTFISNSVTGGDGAVGSYLDAQLPGSVMTRGGSATGGAMFSATSATLIGCMFDHNSATGGKGGGESSTTTSTYFGGDGGLAFGGAVCFSNSLTLVGCTLKNGFVVAGNGAGSYYGGPGGEARGGAIYGNFATLSATNCEFSQNRVAAGFYGQLLRKGNRRADASGGGLSTAGSIVLQNVVVASNYLQGQTGFGGGATLSGNALISGSRFRANHVAGDNLASYYNSGCGPGLGGGICNNGVLTISGTLLDSNRAVGGTNGSGSTYGLGQAGGDGKGGGICNFGTLDLRNSTLADNVAMGGDGGSAWISFVSSRTGGTGLGGGLCSLSGSSTIFNSTLSGNAAVGGKGGDGNPYSYAGIGGTGIGAGIYVMTNSLSATHCTIANNQSTGGGPGGYPFGLPYSPPPLANGMGFDGGIRNVGETAMALTNSIVCGNSQNDINGLFLGDANLIGVDAKLAPLANNGGSTPTMGLYPDSPAINGAVTLAGITSDQRGFVRPIGAGPDIGAFEWNSDSFYTSFRLLDFGRSAGIYHVRVVGPPSQTYRLQTSSDFVSWNNVSTNTTDSLGLRPLENLPSQPGPTAYYRTISP